MRIETPQELLVEGYAPTGGYFQRLHARSQYVRPEIQALAAMMALISVQDVCETDDMEIAA